MRALRTLEYMTHEREFLPWYTALGTRLPYIKRMLYPTNAFGELQVMVLTVLNVELYVKIPSIDFRFYSDFLCRHF